MAVAAAPGVPAAAGGTQRSCSRQSDAAIMQATVVGEPATADSRVVRSRARDVPGARRRERGRRRDVRDGRPAPPAADGPAVFLCGDGQCSSPVREPAEVEAAARAFGSGR
jgi:hypothetical protein